MSSKKKLQICKTVELNRNYMKLHWRKRRKLDIIKLTWVVFTYLLMMLNALFDRLPTDLEFFTTPLLWYGAYLYYKQQNNLLDERHKAGW